jgi:glycosyltransferase involved in cell wall biosynthesis
MRLSICIPTYERPLSLENCLSSLEVANSNFQLNFEICISDNSENMYSEEIVSKFKNSLPITYKRNSTNLGYAGNFKNCVNMASGEFVWLIGDDDIIVPDSFKKLHNLFQAHPDVSFFCINTFMLNSDFLENFEHPFNSNFLPKELARFSNYEFEEEMTFSKLINHRIFFDFLGGMYLSIFRKCFWDANQSVLKLKEYPNKKFEDLDDTFPHAKVFANAFMGQDAYYSNNPVIVAVSGKREWSSYYPLVRTFRLLDLLEEYRYNGLPFRLYIRNKNATYKYFTFDLVYYFAKRDQTWPILDIFTYIRNGFVCPNMYISLLRFILGKLKRIWH